jgi:hypothetical protein
MVISGAAPLVRIRLRHLDSTDEEPDHADDEERQKPSRAP